MRTKLLTRILIGALLFFALYPSLFSSEGRALSSYAKASEDRSGATPKTNGVAAERLRNNASKRALSRATPETNGVAAERLRNAGQLLCDFFVTPAYAASKGADPVAYWRFDEGGGPTAYDETSNNKDGALNAGATGSNTAVGQMWTRQGKIGGALELDGTDDCVQTNYVPNITNNALTVCAWIKPDDVSGTEEISNQNQWDGGPWTGWRFQKEGASIKFKLGDNTSTVYSFSAGTLSAGVWQYVAGVWDGSYIRIYINGKEAGSAPKTFTYVGNTSAYYIGKYAGAAYYFQGLIDDMKIYNYARTPEQILVDYNAGSAAHLGAGADANEGNPPVGYWNFNENTGTTAYDRSGSGNNGTITNAAWAQGKIGPCLSFDGNGDYVNCGAGSSLNISGAISYEAWVKINSYSADTNTGPVIMGSYDSGNGYIFSLQGSAAGAAKLHWRQHGGTGGNVVASDSLAIGRWHHVAGSYDGTTARIYVDGVEKANGAWTTPGNRAAMVIGCASWSIGGAVFDGLIDEVKMYNYARTQAQIAYDYNRGAPVAHYKFDESGGAIAHNEYSLADFGAAPVGWWRMDEGGSSATTIDSSGNGNTATLYPGATGTNTTAANMWDQAGKIGPDALEFDGTNDYISVPINSSLQPQSELTLEVWIKPDASYSGDVIILGQSAYYLTYNSDGSVRCYWYGKSPEGYHSTGAGAATAGAWNHVAAIWSTSTVKIYVNGVEKFSTACTGTGSVAQNQVWLGAESNGSTRQFRGLIDDGRIYNYARTPEQIYNDYKATHGTLVGDAKFMDGKIGKALNFDGVDDYVKITKDDRWQSQDMTVEAWVKPAASQPDTYNGIIGCHGEGSPSQRGWVIQQDSSATNKYYFSYGDGSGWQGDSTTLYSQLTANVWQHIAVTKSGTSLVMYVNGAVSDTHTATNASILYGTGEARPDLYIGDYAGGNRSFNGLIDDVRIYSYARNAEQVLQDYNAGVPARLGAQSAGVADPWGGALPVAHWKLDENTGVKVYDASGNGNNGTITGATWMQGKNGPCLTLDGSGDYVNFGNISAGNFGTNDFTISYWIKTTDVSGEHITKMTSARDSWGIGIGYSGLFYMDLAGGTFTSGNPAEFGSNMSNVADGNWHHVAVKRASGIVTGYKDGIPSNSFSLGTALTSTEPLYIGKSVRTGDLNGLIDDVKIYNYARTQAQIAWDYNNGKPIAHYRLDEATSGAVPTTAGAIKDETANNNATASNTTWTYTAGKFGGALNFDGNDTMSITDTNSLDFGTGDFSISGWIYAVSGTIAGERGIINKNSTFQSTPGWGIETTGQDSTYTIFGYNTNGTWPANTLTASSLTYSAWHHFVLVRVSSVFKLYVDGQEKAVNSTADMGLNVDNSQPIILGDHAWGSNFIGKLDDIRIYNYARTAEQVLQDYLNGASARLGD